MNLTGARAADSDKCQAAHQRMLRIGIGQLPFDIQAIFNQHQAGVVAHPGTHQRGTIHAGQHLDAEQNIIGKRVRGVIRAIHPLRLPGQLPQWAGKTKAALLNRVIIRAQHHTHLTASPFKNGPIKAADGTGTDDQNARFIRHNSVSLSSPAAWHARATTTAGKRLTTTRKPDQNQIQRPLPATIQDQSAHSDH